MTQAHEQWDRSPVPARAVERGGSEPGLAWAGAGGGGEAVGPAQSCTPRGLSCRLWMLCPPHRLWAARCFKAVARATGKQGGVGSASPQWVLAAPQGPWGPGFILREDPGLVSGGWGCPEQVGALDQPPASGVP